MGNTKQGVHVMRRKFYIGVTRGFLLCYSGSHTARGQVLAKPCFILTGAVANQGLQVCNYAISSAYDLDAELQKS